MLKRVKKYMNNYNSTKPSKLISYFDMNNLYGWGMSQYIPHGGFKWLKNVDNFDVNSISEKSSTGCILDVDLDYPNELRYLHNDYPLAPEKLAILYDMLSDYCKNIADKHKKRLLILILGDKTNYVVHYKNLQLYLSLGMKLTKIHTVLNLNNLIGWTFISILTLKRKNAAASFEKNFF